MSLTKIHEIVDGLAGDRLIQALESVAYEWPVVLHQVETVNRRDQALAYLDLLRVQGDVWESAAREWLHRLVTSYESVAADYFGQFLQQEVIEDE